MRVTRIWSTTSILFTLLIAIHQVLAQTERNQTRTDASQVSSAPKLQFEKYTLANGLQVILHQDHKLPVVHVNLWFHVGSKNERVGRSGLRLFVTLIFCRTLTE
jgi:zinc protease